MKDRQISFTAAKLYCTSIIPVFKIVSVLDVIQYVHNHLSTSFYAALEFTLVPVFTVFLLNHFSCIFNQHFSISFHRPQTVTTKPSCKPAIQSSSSSEYFHTQSQSDLIMGLS